MKRISIIAALALIAAGGVAFSQSVHQEVKGEDAYGTKGGKALKEGQLETKDVQGTLVARVKGSMPQWGFVAYWIGLPAPAGESIVRVRVFNTAEEKAKYFLYVKQSDSQKMLAEVKVPDGAPVNEFVDIDIPVDAAEEFSGIFLKKASQDSLPGPWVEKVSVLK